MSKFKEYFNKSLNEEKLNEKDDPNMVWQITQIKDVDKKYPKSVKLFSQIFDSPTFKKYNDKVFKKILNNNVIKRVDANEAFAWLEKELKKIK